MNNRDHWIAFFLQSNCLDCTTWAPTIFFIIFIFIISSKLKSQINVDRQIWEIQRPTCAEVECACSAAPTATFWFAHFPSLEREAYVIDVKKFIRGWCQIRSSGQADRWHNNGLIARSWGLGPSNSPTDLDGLELFLLGLGDRITQLQRQLDGVDLLLDMLLPFHMEGCSKPHDKHLLDNQSSK